MRTKKHYIIFISLFLLFACLEEENKYLNLVNEMNCQEISQSSAEERYKFAELYFSKDTSACISRTVNTVESDPVYQYLLIKNDKAFLISDAREDKFYGEGEKVTKTEIIDIRIGYWDLNENEFYPEESPIRSDQSLMENVLVYSFKEGEYHPFY